MRIFLITIGTSMPAWINEGTTEYLKRLPKDYRCELIEIPAPPRTTRTDITRVMRAEGEALLGKVPRGATVIALDPEGTPWDTPTLAQKLLRWHDESSDLALLVGGSDGLSPEVLSHASLRWSLSRLTFPHPLVRVIIAEQLYRAWSIIQKHPYHR